MRKGAIIGLVAGLSILGVMAYQVGFGEIKEAILSIKPVYLLLFLFIFFLETVVRTLRWWYNLYNMGVRISLSRLYAIRNLGDIFNFVTPIAISGGEIVKTYYIKKASNREAADIFSTIMINLFFDVGSFILLFVFSFVYLLLDGTVNRLIVATVGILAGTVLFLYTLSLYFSVYPRETVRIVRASSRIFSKLGLLVPQIKHYSRKLEKGAKQHALNYSNGVRYCGEVAFFENVLASLIGVTLMLAKTQILFVALGYNPGIQWVVIGIALGLLAGLLPLLPGGLGVSELGFTLGVGLGGVPLAVAFVVRLLDRILYISFLLVVALTSWLLMGLGVEPIEEKNGNA